MDEDEERTMQLAADCCRNRRSDDVRRRTFKVPSKDAYTQTETTSSDEDSSSRVQKLTSIICYIAFALVVQNLCQLRLLIKDGSAHKQYSLIFGLLLISLFLQFLFLYVTKIEKAILVLLGGRLIQDKFNILILIISAVTLINISVFVLS